jgi:hypothetical protein
MYMLTLLLIMTCNNGRNGRHMTRRVLVALFNPTDASLFMLLDIQVNDNRFSSYSYIQGEKILPMPLYRSACAFGKS